MLKRWILIKAQNLLLTVLFSAVLPIFGFIGYKYLSIPTADRLYFSWWDGSSPQMIAYVKAQLPNQHIKHLKTYYQDAGNHYRVVMDYQTHDHAGAYVVQIIGTIDKQNKQFQKTATLTYD